MTHFVFQLHSVELGQVWFLPGQGGVSGVLYRVEPLMMRNRRGTRHREDMASDLLASSVVGRSCRRRDLSVCLLLCRLHGALRAGCPGLQHIEGAHCQLVSVEGLRASGALRAGCPTLQHTAGAHCQLVSDESRRALHALSAVCPGLQRIEGAHCQLVSVPALLAGDAASETSAYAACMVH